MQLICIEGKGILNIEQGMMNDEVSRFPQVGCNSGEFLGFLLQHSIFPARRDSIFNIFTPYES